MSTHEIRRALMIAALLALGGCASAGGEIAVTGHNADLLTAEDMQDYVALDAYAVIRHLRSFWLYPRGTGSWGAAPSTAGTEVQIKVYVDGVLQPSSVEVLKLLPVREIREIRHLCGLEAAMRFGTNHGAGAILFTTGASSTDRSRSGSS